MSVARCRTPVDEIPEDKVVEEAQMETTAVSTEKSIMPVIAAASLGHDDEQENDQQGYDD